MNYNKKNYFRKIFFYKHKLTRLPLPRPLPTRALMATTLGLALSVFFIFCLQLGPFAFAANAGFTNKLTASHPAPGDQFGYSVAINNETKRAVIGAYKRRIPGAKASTQHSQGPGAAYIFKSDTNGLSWQQEAIITASDARAGDYFGSAVAMSADVVVVGAFQNDDKGKNSGAVYIFRLKDGQWHEETKLTASDTAEGDLFGLAVAIDRSGNTVVVGARWDDDHGERSGSAYVFRYNKKAWREEGKLTASDAAEGDFFGNSVAIDNDTIIVGARLNDGASGEIDDASNENSGSAYVFRRSGKTWVEEAKLTAPPHAHMEEDYFGHSVDVNGDIIIVGARYDDLATKKAGAAYVYRFKGKSWQLEAVLTASDAVSRGLFGWSVSVETPARAALGDTIPENSALVLIGAYGDSEDGTDSGSAYVFRYNGEDWQEQAKITLPGAKANDHFAESSALSGSLAVISAHNHDITGKDSGAVLFLNIIEQDHDGDGFINKTDNCPGIFNPEQKDADSDKTGDKCDQDVDGDNVSNHDDNCPFMSNKKQADLDGDQIGDICDNDADGDGYEKFEDCNDTDDSFHPGATDVNGDGIDQDCNGYDLSITIKSAVYDSRKDWFTVIATSKLKGKAGLKIEGFGPMIWKGRKWKMRKMRSGPVPSLITVCGIEGCEYAYITRK